MINIQDHLNISVLITHTEWKSVQFQSLDIMKISVGIIENDRTVQGKQEWTSWVVFSLMVVPCLTMWGGCANFLFISFFGMFLNFVSTVWFFEVGAIVLLKRFLDVLRLCDHQEKDRGACPHGREAVWHIQVRLSIFQIPMEKTSIPLLGYMVKHNWYVCDTTS